MEKNNLKKWMPLFEIILLFIVVFIANLLVGKYLSKPEKYTATFLEAFDTRTEIVGYGKSKEEFLEKANQLKDKLVFYNNIYDIYNSYDGINNIKTINDNAGIKPVEVDREIIELLKYSIKMYAQTNGQTNIAMGSVLKIWHSYRQDGIDFPETARVPREELLIEASKHTDINDIIIDEENSTVFLKDPEMSLDVGSIGKGYAVQKIVDYAKECGMTNMLISVGGNVCALGSHIDGSPWKLGIQNPDLESNVTYIEKVTLSDGECIVSSGDYQRYYIVDGEKYCHIIDPDTLYPASFCSAVSIITNDSGMADALSTSIYNMTIEEGQRFVSGLENVEAMWVLEDGTEIFSENFEKYLAGEAE